MSKLPSSIDPNHNYVFKSGEYGAYATYWYKDRAGNYFKYTNAPIESFDHNIFLGQPILDPEQVFMHMYPQFFTAEGYRRNIAVPDGSKTVKNPGYNPISTLDSWYECYMSPLGDLKYVYLDSDVKENPNLYVQHQIRLVDAGLPKYRKFAAELFQDIESERNQLIGCVLQLADQAFFQVEDLINARIADIDFVDETVYLLGRKLRVDIPLYDFLTAKVAGRPITDPLFAQKTLQGTKPLGLTEICATFAYIRMSPLFLQYWHATHVFSRIVNKHKVLGTSPDTVEGISLSELSSVFNTNADIKYLVDPQVFNTLLRKYNSTSSTEVVKAIIHADSDTFGVAQVFSDLVQRRGDEQSFSEWLHGQPLHYQYEGEGSETEEALVAAMEQERLEEAKDAQKNTDITPFVDNNLDGEPDMAIDDYNKEPPSTVPEEDMSDNIEEDVNA